MWVTLRTRPILSGSFTLMKGLVYSVSGQKVTLVSAEESDPQLTFILKADVLEGDLPVSPGATLPIVFRRQ